MKYKVARLETMARELIGDGRKPNLYFVTDEGAVVTVTRDLKVAYIHWCRLAWPAGYGVLPLKESALEDRRVGVLCSVEPEHDGSKHLCIHDDIRTHYDEADYL